MENLEAIQVARAFCYELLHSNTFNGLIAKGDTPGDTLSGDQDVEVSDSVLEKGWEKEVMSWLDIRVSFPEFILGITQLAQKSTVLGEGDLAARLQVLLEKIEVVTGHASPKEDIPQHDIEPQEIGDDSNGQMQE